MNLRAELPADRCRILGFEVDAQFLGDITLRKDGQEQRYTSLAELEAFLDGFQWALERPPARHSNACSNQNALDPLGAYKDVQTCGCVR